MKSKLNKQQKKYIKACDSKELRKELKILFKRENQNIFRGKSITPNHIFDDFIKCFVINEKGELIKIDVELCNKLKKNIAELKFEFTGNSKSIISFPKQTTETPNSNTLTKETLESLTNPDLIEKGKEFHNAIDEHLEKEELIKLSNSYNGPMKFCVKITDDNKHVLYKIWDAFHNSESGGFLNKFIHSNSLHTHCFTSNVSNCDFKPVKVVSTEEFLRYIGKEHLIEKPKTLEFDLPKTSQKLDELINAIKLTYSQEDMFKCFQGARCMSKPLLFEFESFASYLESLQK